MKRILLLALLTLVGCGSLTPAQQQQVGTQVVNTGLQQLTCIQTQLVSTIAAHQTETKAGVPSGTQLAAWSEQAAAMCAVRYPMTVSIPTSTGQ